MGLAMLMTFLTNVSLRQQIFLREAYKSVIRFFFDLLLLYVSATMALKIYQSDTSRCYRLRISRNYRRYHPNWNSRRPKHVHLGLPNRCGIRKQAYWPQNPYSLGMAILIHLPRLSLRYFVCCFGLFPQDKKSILII
jgi:hypothetical protein